MAIIKEVLFNDGEGVDFNDFNDAQRFLRSQLWDIVVGGLARDGIGVAIDKTTHLHALRDAGAPVPSATALRIDPVGGLLVQIPSATIDGDDATALAYYATAAELQTLHAAGDATHPRWDLVSVRLQNASGGAESRDFEDATTRAKTTTSFDKQSYVTLTKTLTAGTPAASPVLPSVPADHVALYAVRVPASHSAVFGFTDLWDCRMPLGGFVVDSLTREEYARASCSGAGADTLADGPVGAVTSAGVGLTVWHLARGFQSYGARLVGVSSLTGLGCNSSDFDLMRWPGVLGTVPAAISSYGGQNLATALRGNPTGPNTEWRTAALNVGAPSLTALPVWITGYPCGYAAAGERQANGTDNAFSRLVLQWVAGATPAQLAAIRFHFAGGL